MAKKVCPICLEEFEDESPNQSKKACSPEHRRQLAIREDDTVRLQEALNYRVFLLRKHHKVNLTKSQQQDALQKLLSNKCDVCGRTVAVPHLHVDYDPATLEYRGVVCSDCQSILKKAGAPATLQRLLDYVLKNVGNPGESQ